MLPFSSRLRYSFYPALFAAVALATRWRNTVLDPGSMREKSSTERLLALQRSRQQTSWRPPRDAIVLHGAYGTGSNAVIEGRVIDYQPRAHANVNDRKLANLRRNLGLLVNEERAHVPVHISLRTHEWQTQTDEEGYFRLDITNLATLPSGWHRFRASAGDAVDEAGLLLVPPENRHGIISDVDDTILVTEVGSKRRMLINTLLHNPLQRRIVAGMPQLYRRLAAINPVAAAAPVFYLSATPRQLHLPLQAILEHNALPRGVLITKRVTGDATSEPVRDQFAYKTRKIEQLLERLPHVTFTLIGDDAERDPDIFAAIRARHPARIAAVWVRKVNTNPQVTIRPDQGDLAALLQREVAIGQD
jgi:phosphatidate phosphatase APP1